VAEIQTLINLTLPSNRLLAR